MPQSLDWPDCRNARDLGGLGVGTNQQIRDGALIRSDNLDRLTAAGVTAVRQYGIIRIVDVRSEWECQSFPSPFAQDPMWRSAPLADFDVPDTTAGNLIDQYIALLDGYPRRIASAVALVADAPPGGVLVHCHAGKDRTGLIVALAPRIAGVPIDDIAADYAAIGTINVPTLVGTAAGTDGELPAELRPPEPSTMITTLRRLDARYGNVSDYLHSGGCSAQQLQALQRRLT